MPYFVALFPRGVLFYAVYCFFFASNLWAYLQAYLNAYLQAFRLAYLQAYLLLLLDFFEGLSFCPACVLGPAF
jgi:hypothetical protein